MIIHPKKMKKIFILAALAASCVNMSACDLCNAKSSNVEAARSITEAVSKDDANTAENRLESVQGTQNRGEYISQSFSLVYPQDIMHLEEQEVSEEGDTFLISLTKKGEDLGSVPRIDIISVDVSGLTENAVKELSNEDAGQAFESFAASLLTAYYHIGLDEHGNAVGGTAPTMEFRDTTVRVEGEKKVCETRSSVSKTDDLPAMQAAIKLQGETEDGLVSIIFVQDGLDEESEAILDSIVASIQLK